MITDEYREYLRSDTWQRLRSKRLAIDEYQCQRCGSPYGLQVHHLAYPVELGTENPYTDLITLCGPCHELVENQKKAYRQDEVQARIAKCENDKKLIYKTILRLSCYDLSTVGVGTKDYCNIDVIKTDFGPILEQCDLSLGYVSRVQNYFRNRRYQVILTMMEGGCTRQEVIARTKFSYNMVDKVFTKPENARAMLAAEKKERIANV